MPNKPIKYIPYAYIYERMRKAAVCLNSLCKNNWMVICPGNKKYSSYIFRENCQKSR
jgi:hypothetical protein